VKDAGYLELLGRLAQACLEHTDAEVLIVLEQNDVASRAAWDALAGRLELDRGRIQFYEAKALDSIWLRDYGPIFVRRRDDQQMFVVDAAYRDLRMITEETAVSLMGLGPTLRPADDLAPIYFATLLKQPFVHPGFALNGGDLYADGQGTLYTSEETVHLNTGDREYVETAFRQFLGVSRTCYLRSLPGPTVKHIDMLFKLVSSTTCLVGQYGEPDQEPELASLQRAAAQALDQNAADLAQLGLRVIRVPMPDITRITRWDYLGRVFSDQEREQRVRELAVSSELPEESIREKLRERPTYVYRTYLNSILLASGARGDVRQPDRRVLILPHYPSAVPDDVLERARSAYREAYGDDVPIALVDAESLAHANGSLRCIACPVPEK
jgi:agmatine/peptidylarginine deiminase